MRGLKYEFTESFNLGFLCTAEIFNIYMYVCMYVCMYAYYIVVRNIHETILLKASLLVMAGIFHGLTYMD